MLAQKRFNKLKAMSGKKIFKFIGARQADEKRTREREMLEAHIFPVLCASQVESEENRSVARIKTETPADFDELASPHSDEEMSRSIRTMHIKSNHRH